MRRLTLGLILLATAAPSLAQETPQGARSGTPQRIRNVMLKPGEKCPEAQGDEIVVCGRIDPEEQYRIPKEFRDAPVVAGNQSWTNRAQTMMDANRAGLPNSCSPVGTGGQTGCNQQMIDQWFEWRRAQRAEAAKVP
ncbi:hypothetical protein [uncultured Sphingomonas sp.]|jgi:hypothetical protein|uniref:hypothetical protein n=1 Tax=uncultured Sphingomonas sp. TaxID=158754 RepID=UPI0025F5E562|nr:hypothetical protein [uncultured Sphingomonas sp.]